MKHILLPTDFSDNSWDAIKYAIKLFKDEACTFNLLNTFKPVTQISDRILGNSAKLSLDETFKNLSIERLKEFLESISETFKDNPKHKFKIISLYGSLVPGINEFMSENKIDLIVMGTKGATGSKEVLFGSNAVHVFKEIKCPILAIPSDFKYETPHEILFPTDLLVDYNTFQIDILKEITTANNSRVNALHVSNDELTDKQIRNQLELESQFKETPFLFHHFKSRNVLAAIDEFQIKSEVNLLAMINNKRSFFESLFFKSNIDQIGFHLKEPFLVIPSRS